MRSRTLIGASLFTAVTCASCASASPTTDEAPAGISTEALTPLIEVETGFDPATLTLRDSEEDLAYRAWQLLMKSCMEDLGFDFTVFERPDFASPRPDDSPTATGESGYRPPEGLDTTLPVSPNDTRADSDPSFRAALYGGEDENGCSDQSLRVLDVGLDENNFPAISGQILTSIREAEIEHLETGEFQGVVDRWSSCMSERGYTHSDREAAASQFVEAPELTDLEIRTRTDDLDCARDVNWWSEHDAAIAAAHATWAVDNQALVAESQELKREYLDLINSIIGEHS